MRTKGCHTNGTYDEEAPERDWQDERQGHEHGRAALRDLLPNAEPLRRAPAHHHGDHSDVTMLGSM